MHGQNGAPISPPFWSQSPSLQWARIEEGIKGTGGNIIGPGEPKKSCHWLTGPLEACHWSGGTPQKLGIGLRRMPLARGWFCHSLWLWSERKRSGNEAQAGKIKDRVAAAGPAGPLSGPSQGKGTQTRVQVARSKSPPPWDYPSRCPS